MIRAISISGIILLQIGDVANAITQGEKWSIVGILIAILFYFGWRDYTKDQKINTLLEKISSRDESFSKLMSDFNASLQGLNSTLSEIVKNIDELYDKSEKIHEKLLEK